jgi:hypothetical protein
MGSNNIIDEAKKRFEKINDKGELLSKFNLLKSLLSKEM